MEAKLNVVANKLAGDHQDQLGYVSHTTQNIIQYNVESQQCKITVHYFFDDGFNDVPVKSLYPNAQNLLCVANGNNLTKKDSIDTSSDLEFYIYPFSEKQTTIAHVSPTGEDHTLGYNQKIDELFKKVYIGDTTKRSSVSSIDKSQNSFRDNLKGTFLTHINDVPVFQSPIL